jgi:hypothetical protein
MIYRRRKRNEFMNCVKCGNEFKENAKFCNKCGAAKPTEAEPSVISEPAPQPVIREPAQQQPVTERQKPMPQPAPQQPAAAGYGAAAKKSVLPVVIALGVAGLLVIGGIVAAIVLATRNIISGGDVEITRARAEVTETATEPPENETPAVTETPTTEEIKKTDPLAGKWNCSFWDEDGDLTVYEMNFLDGDLARMLLYWPDVPGYGKVLYEGSCSLSDGVLVVRFNTKVYDDGETEPLSRTYSGDFGGDGFFLDIGDGRTFGRGEFKRDSMPPAPTGPATLEGIEGDWWTASWRDSDGDLVEDSFMFDEDGTFIEVVYYPDLDYMPKYLYSGEYTLRGDVLTLYFQYQYKSYDDFDTLEEIEDYSGGTVIGDYYGKRFVIAFDGGETYTFSRE